MRRFGELYHFWLHEAPLLTKVVTAATLFGTGDRIAQRLEANNNYSIFGELSSEHAPHQKDKGSKLISDSAARTLRMMVWGGLFAAPIMHTWFHVVERVIPGTGKLVVAKKVAADMMIIAPGTSLAFFTTTKCMEGEPLHESFQIAKAKLTPTLLADYMLWPAANAVIFGLVPLHYRTPLTHCVSLVWSAFLSEMASHEPPQLMTPRGTSAPKPPVPSSSIAL
ncbi:Mpv17 / PMP22 family [Phytophthora infestans]|uniref:Mpv17 / PMP22 family n=1 Tax=Phytophthora infestans TaxID=4787 RepID=A0A833TIB5_PHYIN|nr:Mpv17 / PMP22 family [Phytophthora infestans]KAF4129129.1 Mpv17 / PMP22 family [Phytophthora infestans]